MSANEGLPQQDMGPWAVRLDDKSIKQEQVPVREGLDFSDLRLSERWGSDSRQNQPLKTEFPSQQMQQMQQQQPESPQEQEPTFSHVYKKRSDMGPEERRLHNSMTNLRRKGKTVDRAAQPTVTQPTPNARTNARGGIQKPNQRSTSNLFAGLQQQRQHLQQQQQPATPFAGPRQQQQHHQQQQQQQQQPAASFDAPYLTEETGWGFNSAPATMQELDAMHQSLLQRLDEGFQQLHKRYDEGQQEISKRLDEQDQTLKLLMQAVGAVQSDDPSAAGAQE